MKIDVTLAERERAVMQQIAEAPKVAKSKREAARVAAIVLAQVAARLRTSETILVHVEPETWRESA